MEPRKMTKEQKSKLEKIKPGDVILFHPYQTGNYNKYLDNTKTQIFLVWEINSGETEIMNITGQIISDEDPYGQAPDSIDIGQVVGEGGKKERELAKLCSEWRNLNKVSNLDVSVDVPEGTTWEQFKKMRGYETIKFTSAEETVSVRIYQSDKDWLLNHRDSKRKGIADVLHEIIEFWDMAQND